MLSFVSVVSAQTFDEWFRQNKTQRKYLLQQIAALRTYGSYLAKGYRIVQSGLHTIENIKQGDFHLHNVYFNSFKTVNPNIQRYIKIAEIIVLKTSMVKESVTTIQFCRKSGQLTNAELDYLLSVFSALLDDCFKSYDALSNVLKDGKLRMTDDERIAVINDINNAMIESDVFCNSFSAAARGLCIQRKNDYVDILQSQKINGIR